MYADGENQVVGKLIRAFGPSGELFSQYVITPRGDTPNAPNGQNQRTILISSLFTPANVTADYVAPVADLQLTGQDGAVCYTENDPPTYTPIDCVAYGNFTGRFSRHTGRRHTLRVDARARHHPRVPDGPRSARRQQ